MAIKMPHKPAKPASADAKAEAFISGGSLKAETSTPAQTKETFPTTVAKAVVNMRFDSVLLERIDASAKKRGISRTAWLHWAAAEMLGERN
jgi:predicted DNA binding CopG/RHH family protein